LTRTAKYLGSANQLNEASKHLLNKKQTGEQQSTSQSINQSANQPINQPINQSINQSTNQPTNHPTNQPTNNTINQTTTLEEPFLLMQTRQVKTSQASCMNIKLTYKVAAF